MKKKYSYKRKLLHMILLLEIGLFAFYYIKGNKGLHSIWQLDQENKEIESKIFNIKQEICKMNNSINDFSNYPWQKEKIAREDLQMAYPEETVYLIK